MCQDLIQLWLNIDCCADLVSFSVCVIEYSCSRRKTTASLSVHRQVASLCVVSMSGCVNLLPVSRPSQHLWTSALVVTLPRAHAV